MLCKCVMAGQARRESDGLICWYDPGEVADIRVKDGAIPGHFVKIEKDTPKTKSSVSKKGFQKEDPDV